MVELATINGQRLLDRRAAAKVYGVSVDTIRRAQHQGLLPAKQTGKDGGKTMYRVADLEAWSEQLEDA